MGAKPGRILVVHDEIEMQIFLSTLLESGGYTAITTGDSSECLEMALREKPDLIIIEGIMPQVCGGQLYCCFKREAVLKDIPIIVISSLPCEAVMTYQKIHSPSSGVVIPEPEAYLKKPPEREELLDVVGRLIQAGPGAHPS